jgi:aryl-alcohol dehydrogenase-like predicted oxidoreductase
VDRIDLMQIHNFHGIDELLPALQEFRQAGRVRYVGITTSQQEQYPLMLDAMRRHRLDFIQVNYSLGNREAAREVLPLAQELGIAVLVNMPLGGRRGTLLADIGDRPLPALAREIDAGSWAQLLLKYVISHPAVTCAIPGTTRLAHVADNQKAGRGRLPDAAMRGRIEALWSEI